MRDEKTTRHAAYPSSLIPPPSSLASMISAIVLAAGQATRFGQCKQLMRLGEKALLQHVLDNLAQSKIDEVVVVLGARADEIREQIQFGTARVIMNPDYANGMSTSIQAGLRAIDAEAAMIVLADQPFAMATVVRAERPTSSKPGDKAIIAPDGTLTGWIGGSCAHDIVVRNALESLEEGSPRFLTLSSASPSETKRQGVIDVPMQCYSGGVLDVFIEPNLPKPQMVVVGYETVARALVLISRTLQFHVTVVDPLATRESVPEADAIVNELKLPALQLSGDSFIVIATHG